MANSGTIKGSSASNGNYLYIEWSESSVSTANNTSKVTATVKLYNAYGSYSSGDACPWYVIIDGTKVSGTIYTWSGSPVTVGSASKVVTHNSNGSKSITISAYFDTAGTSTGTVTASGTATLTSIPRYATSSQSLASKTETSITMNWSSDSTIDYIWYSLNNGSSWTAVGSVNASSGQYTISGLSAGATYNVKTRVRRKDSQLSTDSGALSIATYAYPYCSNAPTFEIGEDVVLTLANPLARESTVTVTAGNTTILTTTTTGTSVTIPPTVADTLYQSIPNASQGTYTVTVTYSGHTTNTNGTYKVGQAAAPTIGSGTYQDTDSTVTAITGNNQKIIQGKSKVQFTASGLSAKNSATLSSCKVTVNNTDYPMTLSGSSATVSNITINSSEQTTAVITVTDSRGLTGTKTVTLDIVEYQVPTVSATAKRRNGFYTATDVNTSTNYTYIGSNAVTIQLKARVVGTSTYTVTQTLADGSNVVNLDNQYPWEIVLTITDSFGGSSTFNLSIGKGIPLFYFDIVKESVSMDMFPTHSNAFEVSGDIYINGRKITDFVVDEGTDGIWTYRKWASGIAECWGYVSASSTAMTTHYGSMYYSSLITQAFPTGLFMNYPKSLSVQAYDNGNGTYTSIQTWTKDNVTFYAYGVLSHTISVGYIFDIKGEWDTTHFDPSSLPNANGEEF